MKVLVAGDFVPNGRVADLFNKGDYACVLDDIRKVTDTVDYSIVNLECPVSIGYANPIEKFGPNLCCSVTGIDATKYAGFNCVTLANNHFLDYGEQGVLDTLKTCKEKGLDVVGGGKDIIDASSVLYKEINGQRIAVINCCEHEFSIATESTAGSNPLNPIQQYYAINEARKKADYVLVVVHGGHEHFQLPSPRMVETYRFFVDAGADAVINHHQHCFSGYEIYKGKPIFYGLGNFCFDNNYHIDSPWNYGYMVNIEFGINHIHFQIVPYRQCGEKPCVELLEPNSLNDKLEYLNHIISDSNVLKNAIDEYYESNVRNCSNIFEPTLNRYFLGALRRGWIPSTIKLKRKLYAADYILCESNRDKMAYWLNTVVK